MAFETNKFCWHGCISTDPDASKAFYTEVLGWKADTQPMGDSDATFFQVAGKGFAHLAPPSAPGTLSHWNNYLRVDDVDASTKKAVANGGKQIVAPTDIPPGRFSTLKSPSGAAFSLFHEADPVAEHHPGGPGSVHWVELNSQDISADVKWLTSTFGLETEVMDMPMGPYTVLKSGDSLVGGAMASQQEQAPSMWLTWIHVTGVDDTVAKASGKGGKVVVPAFDVPNIGRMAIIQDPTGGVVGVITPPARA